MLWTKQLTMCSLTVPNSGNRYQDLDAIGYLGLEPTEQKKSQDNNSTQAIRKRNQIFRNCPADVYGAIE